MVKEPLFILLVFFIMIFACQSEQDKKFQFSSSVASSRDIKISQEKIISKPLPVEAYIKNIIPLETNNESIINNYYKLEFSEDKLIILDNMQKRGSLSKPKVLMFDTLGNFLKIVGSNGKGPHEYLSPINIQIGQRGDFQVYCNVKSSILSYDINGNYLSSTKLPIRTPYFATLNNGDIAFECLTKINDFQIGIYRKSKDTMVTYLPVPNHIKNAVLFTTINPEFGFSKFKNEYYICPQMSNKIYKIINQKPVVQYKLDIGGFDFYLPKSPDNLQEMGKNKIFEIQKLKRYKSDGNDQLEAITYLQSNLYEKINFFFNWGGGLYTILREKNSGRLIIGSTTQSKRRLNLIEISNLLLFHAKSTNTNGDFVATLNSEDLKNLSKIYHEQSSHKLNQLCFNPVKLKSIADGRNEWSNHVLVVFTLKEVKL